MGNIKYASKIDLSNKGLDHIPLYIFECKNLKTLNLSNNIIKEIPIELSNLKQLKNLDISNNKISQLYAKIFLLSNLQCLNISNNQIRSIPKQIGFLARLNKLLMAGNLIEKLPEEIEHLTTLKMLNISNNLFVNFPESIFKLSGLTHLWISHNNLEKIPSDEILKSFAYLKAVYCYEAAQGGNDQNRNLELLTKQRGNAVNTIKLMGYRRPQSKTNTPSHSRPPQKIFISYSHKDEKYKDEVEITLNALKNTLPDLEFEYWVDTKIDSGKEWVKEIENALDTSGVAILIISRYFLASDFIMKTEVPTILKNVEKKGVVVLSIIVGHCRFKKSVLGRFQAVNEPSKPLKSLSEHDQDVIYNNLSDDVERSLLR